MNRAGFLVAAITVAFLATSAEAGTICGTVRDAQTFNPVPRAGLFVRTTAGAYTGFNGASDNLGRYCIDGIPPGTYDIEIRVDNYLTAYVRNVQVVDNVSGVDVNLPETAVRLLPPFPNPASGQVRFTVRLPDDAPATLVVTDAQGRLIQGWEDRRLAAGEHVVTWDFHDRAGRPVASGRYFVRLRAANFELIRSFVHLVQ